MATEGGGFKGSHILVAFLAGAAAGAIIAYLTAPESGRRNRERVKKAARSVERAAREAPARLSDSWFRAADAARTILEDALDESARR
ncbi:MAG TPA: YtxH domain-containing protein [Candidatus Cryosericum sp.]|nr:YtxH domain-containing protein [Candidatus Cryosericum sp.]